MTAHTLFKTLNICIGENETPTWEVRVLVIGIALVPWAIVFGILYWVTDRKWW